MKTSEELQEELYLLANLTRRTGIIHDAQTLQLELWPFMLIESIVYNKISIDRESHSVLFEISITKKITKKKAKEAQEKLQEWIRVILWEDTSVQLALELISLNGEKENEGRPKRARRKSNKKS